MTDFRTASFALAAMAISVVTGQPGRAVAQAGRMPMGKVRPDKPPVTSAVDITGKWKCTSSTLVDGLTIAHGGKVDYAPGGGSVELAMLRLSKDSAVLDYKFASSGTWKITGKRLCETLGSVKIEAANKAAATAPGQQILGGLLATYNGMIASGKATCFEIVRFDTNGMALQSIDDKSLMTTCSR